MSQLGLSPTADEQIDNFARDPRQFTEQALERLQSSQRDSLKVPELQKQLAPPPMTLSALTPDFSGSFKSTVTPSTISLQYATAAEAYDIASAAIEKTVAGAVTPDISGAAKLEAAARLKDQLWSKMMGSFAATEEKNLPSDRGPTRLQSKQPQDPKDAIDVAQGLPTTQADSLDQELGEPTADPATLSPNGAKLNHSDELLAIDSLTQTRETLGPERLPKKTAHSESTLAVGAEKQQMIILADGTLITLYSATEVNPDTQVVAPPLSPKELFAPQGVAVAAIQNLDPERESTEPLLRTSNPLYATHAPEALVGTDRADRIERPLTYTRTDAKVFGVENPLPTQQTQVTERMVDAPGTENLATPLSTQTETPLSKQLPIPDKFEQLSPSVTTAVATGPITDPKSQPDATLQTLKLNPETLKTASQKTLELSPNTRVEEIPLASHGKPGIAHEENRPFSEFERVPLELGEEPVAQGTTIKSSLLSPGGGPLPGRNNMVSFARRSLSGKTGA